MYLKQLGNGGAFNHNMVNSSFIIENEGEYILFDCGHSVYAELRRQDEDININFDLKKLTSVFISHLDDDHVGSLKTLVYYQYFMNGIKLDISCGDEDVYVGLSNLLSDIDSVVEDGKKVKRALFSLTEIDAQEGDWFCGILISPTVTDHLKGCSGAIFSDKSAGEAIYITGDTKAMPNIRNIIENIDCSYPKYKVFHDFSNWDCPEKQVHACKSDVDEFYTDVTKSRITWYHNDKPFDNSWQKIKC